MRLVSQDFRKKKRITEQEGKERVKRKYLWLPKEKIVRDREGITMKSIKGTRKLHVAKQSKSTGFLEIRNLSCFCNACLDENFENCTNKEYVGNNEKLKCQYQRAANLRKC